MEANSDTPRDPQSDQHPLDSRPSDLLSREECLEMFRQLYLARYFDVRLIKEK